MNNPDLPAAADSPGASEPEKSAHGVRLYIAIGVLLAIMTLVEVQLPRMLPHGALLIVWLLITAFIKAGLVAAFYMHLKYDSRVYTAVMLLAIFLVAYFLWLLTFGQL